MTSILLLFIFLFFFFFRYPKLIFLVYLSLVFIWPRVIVGSVSLRIEHIITPILFLLCFFRFGLRIPRYYSFFFSWIILLTTVTFFSGEVSGRLQLFQSIYGYARLVMVAIIAFSLFSNYSVKKTRFGQSKHIFLSRLTSLESSLLIRDHFLGAYLSSFLVTTLPVLILSLGQFYRTPLANALTVNWYSSPYRLSILTNYEELMRGVYFRAVGVFENVSYLGAYATFAFFLSGYYLFVSAQKIKPESIVLKCFSFLTSCFLGIVAASSAFIGGAIFNLGYFLSVLLRRPNLKKALLIVFIFILFLVGFLYLEKTNSFFFSNIQYQVRKVFSGGIQQRYGDNSINADAFETMRRFIFFGYGAVKESGIFVGDSLYVSLIYTGGLVGSLFFFLPFLLIIKRLLFCKNVFYKEALILMILNIFVLGVSSSVLFIPRLSDWLWGFVGIACAYLREPFVGFGVKK